MDDRYMNEQDNCTPNDNINSNDLYGIEIVLKAHKNEHIEIN